MRKIKKKIRKKNLEKNFEIFFVVNWRRAKRAAPKMGCFLNFFLADYVGWV